jgi:CheY-like chemotaxis protein
MGAYGDLLDGECKLSPEEEEQQQLPYRHSASERELPIGGGFGRSLSPTNFKPPNPVAVVLADMEPSILRIHSYDTPPVAVNQHRSNFNSTGGGASGKKEASTDIVIVKKYHVLVVDDSSLNRRMLCKALSSINCTTEEAEDGLQAVEMVERSLVMACCSEQPQLDVQLEGNRKPGATPVPPSLGAQPRGRSIKDVVNRKKKEAADGIGSQLKMLALPFSSVGLTGAATAAAAAAASSKEKRRLPALIVEENSRDLLSTSDHKSLSKKPSAGGLISRPKSSDFLSSEHERDARRSSMDVNSIRERSGRLSFPIANSERVSQQSQDSQAVSAIEQSIAIARRSLKELPAVIEDESPQAATPTIADLEAGEHSSATSHASSTHRIRQFDFILCDNVMPVMDGPTAVKKMRELGYTAPVFGMYSW